METYNFIKENRSLSYMCSLTQNVQEHLRRMEDRVPEDVKNDRVHRLIELSNQLAKEYASAFEGEVLEIIPEEQFKEGDREGLYVGYTDNYLKIVFEGSEENW